MTDAEKQALATENQWLVWRQLPDERVLAVTVRAFNTILTIGAANDFHSFYNQW